MLPEILIRTRCYLSPNIHTPRYRPCVIQDITPWYHIKNSSSPQPCHPECAQYETVKLIEENIGESFCDPWIRTDISNKIEEVQNHEAKIDRSEHIKIRISVQ